MVVLRFVKWCGRKLSMTRIPPSVHPPLGNTCFQKHNGAFLRWIGVFWQANWITIKKIMILNTAHLQFLQEGVVLFNMCSNLTMQLEDGVKDSCSVNFVIFAEKCLWESSVKEVTLFAESQFRLSEAFHQIWFLRNLRNLQRD